MYQDVVTVVTDNAKSIKKMHQILNDADPDMRVYGCSALWLNHFRHDINLVL